MQFNKLNVPEHWERYWTKYPQGMTILESLYEWVSQVDAMVDNVNDWNNYLDEFVKTFDSELQQTVSKTLLEWEASGFLSEIIDSTLFKFTNKLDTKRDKSTLITRSDMNVSTDNVKLSLDNLNDEARAAMAGTTPINPIIGARQITKDKLALNSVGTEETDWLVNNYGRNLFDGIYRTGSVRGAAGAFYIEGLTNANYKMAVVSVSPSTEYYLKRALPSRMNLATSTKSMTTHNQPFDGAVQINNSGSGVSYAPQYTRITTGPNDRYLYISMSVDGSEPFLSISKTPQENNEYFYHNQPRPTVDIVNGSTTINNYNLFGGVYERDMTIQGAAPFKLVNQTGGRTAIIPIVPNTVYTLVRETPSRLNWGTATKLLAYEQELDGSIKLNNSDTGLSSSPEIITFTTGPNDRWLYANMSNANTEPFLKVVQGIVKDKGRFTYNDRKLNNNFREWLNNSVLEETQNLKTELTGRKILAKYNGSNALEIYVPSAKSSRYVRYSYQLINTSGINMNQWRVLKTYITDSNLATLYDIDQQTEWEGAIKEVGQEDYMGGTHGDEINESISFLFDGQEMDMTKAFNIEVGDEIKIVTKSILNRVSDPTKKLLQRFKISKWTLGEYTVENKYTALSAFQIFESKITLVSCRYNNSGGNLVKFGRRDTSYYKTPISAADIGDLSNPTTDAREFEIWGDNIYISATCEAEFSKYPNTNQLLANFSADAEPRCKIYFDVTGNYAIKLNEQLNNKSTYKIIV